MYCFICFERHGIQKAMEPITVDRWVQGRHTSVGSIFDFDTIGTENRLRCPECHDSTNVRHGGFVRGVVEFEGKSYA